LKVQGRFYDIWDNAFNNGNMIKADAIEGHLTIKEAKLLIVNGQILLWFDIETKPTGFNMWRLMWIVIQPSSKCRENACNVVVWSYFTLAKYVNENETLLYAF
jgi:hypothetical protein